MNATRLFIPGPTEIHPDVGAALLRPMMSHRGGEFREMFARLQSGLKTFFATHRPIVVATSSSTALMEMAIRSAPPGRILALVNGGFSARFAEVAVACGRDVTQLDAPWGSAHDFADVERALKAEQIAAICVVQCETSTGVLTDVAAITGLAHEHGAVALVDAVSSMGGAACETDAWELDFAFVGSQKTLALPPGLAFAAATDRMVATARENRGRGYYLDLAAYIDEVKKNETPSTPGLALLHALDVQLERVAAETMPARLARHSAMARVVYDWVDRTAADDLGTGVLAPAGNRSPTVTVITLSDRTPTAHVLHAMKSRGFTVGAGYGPLNGSSIRIGHMGEHDVASVTSCLDALDDALRNVMRRNA